MPDLPLNETLQDHWQSLGLARALPMGGLAGFEWQEVAAYMDAAQEKLHPQEVSCLVDMSRAYANGYADTNPLSIPPMERDL